MLQLWEHVTRRSTSGNDMLEECQYYIEWTAAVAKPEIASELVDMQVMIGLRRSGWSDAHQNRTQRIRCSPCSG